VPKPHPLFSRPDPAGTREAAKVVLVGQAPSMRGSEVCRAALGGPVGRKLMEVLGCDLRSYVRGFRRLNLVQSFPGRTNGADAFDAAEAGMAWARLRENVAQRMVVLLGAKVADVATVGLWRAHGWCAPFDHLQVRMMVVPHPSGLNRWWNDPANTAAATIALRRFCAEALPA